MKLILLILFIFFIARYIAIWQGTDMSDIYTSKPIYLGHRGDRVNFPDNTLTSYRSAVSKGLDGIEMDVMSTKDGMLICSHNYDLERETTGTGFVDEVDYKDLAKVQTGREFPASKQESIPLLMDAVNSLPKTAILNIEIKTNSKFDIKTAIKVAKLIRNGDISQRVIVSSFNPLAVRVVKFISKAIPTGYIYSKEKNIRGVYIARPDCLHPKVDLVTEKIITFCNKRNMRINTWTVNNAQARDWLIEKNIDGIITDHPTLSKMD